MQNRITGLVPDRLKKMSVEGIWDMTVDEVNELIQNGKDADPDPPYLTRRINNKWVPAETAMQYEARTQEVRLFAKLRRIIIRDMFPDLVFKDPTIKDLAFLDRKANRLDAPLRVPPVPPSFREYVNQQKNDNGILSNEFLQMLANRVHEEYMNKRIPPTRAEIESQGFRYGTIAAEVFIRETSRARFADFSMRSVYSRIYAKKIDQISATRNIPENVKSRIKDIGFELKSEAIERQRIADAENVRKTALEIERRAAVAAEVSKLKSVVLGAVSKGEVDTPLIREFLKLISGGQLVSSEVAENAKDILKVLEKMPQNASLPSPTPLSQ